MLLETVAPISPSSTTSHRRPPAAGNQFLAGLVGELRRRGLEIEVNRISGETPVCLFNSFNFDHRRLRRFARAGCRMVHRVDGPIGVYRGFDDGTDRHIFQLNSELADATVFQSRYSLEKHRELGLELREPVVIPNAPDPAVFNAAGRVELRAGEPVRLITTSWSDNPRKGADVIAELERGLDPARFQLTFVGHSPVEFERARIVSAGSIGRGRPAAPRASRLRLREPQRGVLELAARGARLRPPGPLRRQRLERRGSERRRAAVRATQRRPRCASTSSSSAGPSCRRQSMCPRCAETADRYLEVLRP